MKTDQKRNVSFFQIKQSSKVLILCKINWKTAQVCVSHTQKNFKTAQQCTFVFPLLTKRIQTYFCDALEIKKNPKPCFCWKIVNSLFFMKKIFAQIIKNTNRNKHCTFYGRSIQLKMTISNDIWDCWLRKLYFLDMITVPI